MLNRTARSIPAVASVAAGMAMLTMTPGLPAGQSGAGQAVMGGGDQTPSINDFNRDVFIPALKAAGKSLKVLTYPGELHSFAFYNTPDRTPRPAVALEAFEEIDAFFREHVRAQPRPVNPVLVQHVPVEME